MKETAYNQMIRALTFCGLKTTDTIRASQLEFIIEKMRDSESLKIKKMGISELEYQMITYRFGFEDGIVKTIKQASNKFAKSEKEYKTIEMAIVKKMVLLIDSKKRE